MEHLEGGSEQKVLRIITRLNVGGPARQEIPLGPAMRTRGYDAPLVHGNVDRDEGELGVPRGASIRIPELIRPLSPRHDMKALMAIDRLIVSSRPQLVHTHLAKAGFLGRAMARRRGIPVVHTFHGHVLNEYFGRLQTRAFRKLEKWLARRSDALVAVSPAVRDELLAMGIGQPEQWRVIPIGLDLSPFLTGSVSRKGARAALRLPLDRPIVGIVGRLVPIKDHITFLTTASLVAKRLSSAYFVVAGDGRLRASLERIAHRELGNVVRFLGWVEDLPMLYRALDVVVLTSRNEGTPVALIEAGAAERPVVATSVGGVSSVVEHGKTGYTTPVGRSREISNHILALLSDPEQAKQFGKHARESMTKRFTVARLADDLASLYKEILERKRPQSA